MLKKIASDALGLADIGKFVEPENYDKTQSDDFIREHDGEYIHCLIATKADEYCFTNMAIIHIDGTRATSTKRTMRRYPYYKNKISDVLLETAGHIDLDVELKFKIGSEWIEIDVARNQLNQLKPLYSALLSISEEMDEKGMEYENALQALQHATETHQHARIDSQPATLKDSYKSINEYAYSWLEKSRERYMTKDYGYLFEQYL